MSRDAMMNGHHHPSDQPPSAWPPARPDDHLIERLRAAGLRVTAQRLVILGSLRPDEHVSADEVLTRVEHRLPAVNRSTVYRALEQFRDAGLVSETDLGGGVRRFELIESERHHHLICHGCGAVTELDDAMLAPLRQALRERHGFAATIDHLAVFGWCAACESDRQPPAGGETDGEGAEA